MIDLTQSPNVGRAGPEAKWLSAVELDCEETGSWRLLTSFSKPFLEDESGQHISLLTTIHPLLHIGLFLHVCLGSSSYKSEGASFPEGNLEDRG